MTDPLQLRRRVRWVLSTLPRDQRLSEEMIFDKLRPDFPKLKTAELATALHNNHSLNYIEYRYSQDEERNEWCLTAEGWKKEGF